MMRSLRIVPLLALGIACTAGCTNAGGITGGAATQRGDLGNGDFTFQCDDTVACERWSGTADRFPDRVAKGSTFDLNYSLDNNGVRVNVTVNEPPVPTGYRMDTIGGYASKTSSGLRAEQAGLATIVVRDGKGWVVDYTTIRIVKPESLVIFDSESPAGDNPFPTTKVDLNLTNATRKSFRVVATYELEPVAGAIPVKWTSDDPTVVDIEGYVRGKVTFAAKKAGTTTLRAAGTIGSDTNVSIPVEVKP